MNKRQAKKKKKKYLPVIADEFNLLGMTDKERESAILEYVKFVEKYAYRKHYRDLKKHDYLVYAYPAPKAAVEMLRKFTSRCRKHNSKSMIVSQSLDDFNP
jgi:hypothetical protein